MKLFWFWRGKCRKFITITHLHCWPRISTLVDINMIVEQQTVDFAHVPSVFTAKCNITWLSIIIMVVWYCSNMPKSCHLTTCSNMCILCVCAPTQYVSVNPSKSSQNSAILLLNPNLTGFQENSSRWIAYKKGIQKKFSE